MQYVKFGNLETEVSRFGMGCMRLPQTKTADGKKVIDETAAIEMIRYAIDHGVNYLDTAYAYKGSEEVVGKALKDGYREKVVIATKTPVSQLKEPGDYQRFYEAQVSRLQVDCIDVYILHCLDRSNWEKVKQTSGIDFMEDLKTQGKIRQIGFSFHADYELFQEIVDAYPWDMCLIQLNILDDQHQAGIRGLEYAASKGIPVAIMEPLKGGLLGNTPPQEVSELLNSFEEKRSLVEWAFRWLYDRPEAKVILSGVSTMDQLKDNLQIFQDADCKVMTEENHELIKQIKGIYHSIVKVGCTACGYCLPCPAGVNIPEIFKVYNDAGLSTWTEYGKVFYSLVASNSGKDASNCLECGGCQKRCPQNIPIIDILKQAHVQMT